MLNVRIRLLHTVFFKIIFHVHCSPSFVVVHAFLAPTGTQEMLISVLLSVLFDGHIEIETVQKILSEPKKAHSSRWIMGH